MRQVLRLVDDLLDIARVARGGLVLEKHPLELSLVVRNAVEAIRPAVIQRGHLLRIDVPEVGLVVDGDEARLTQVVTNLLINSVRYTETGGTITIAARRDGEEAVLQVSDNGQGIEAERLPHIFDSFGKARSPGSSGLGLGLTIVHNLVELHGGTATARSDGPGRGATFEVRLRTFAAPPARAEPAHPTPPPAVQRRRFSSSTTTARRPTSSVKP